MAAIQVIFHVIISLVALKVIIGFHWPWEPIVKVKRSLQQNLDSIKDRIPQTTYTAMQESIKKI